MNYGLTIALAITRVAEETRIDACHLLVIYVVGFDCRRRLGTYWLKNALFITGASRRLMRWLCAA